MTGIGVIGNSYLTDLTQSISSLTGTSSSSTGVVSSTSSTTGSNSLASISGPGQLYSALQQLQTKNPAKFKQVVGQIADQLNSAAQQTQGGQSKFLSSLAQKFENVANGGSLDQLAPQSSSQQPHHHHHRVSSAYSSTSASANSSSNSIAGLDSSSATASSTDTSGSSSSLSQLFSSILSEVNQALAS